MTATAERVAQLADHVSQQHSALRENPPPQTFPGSQGIMTSEESMELQNVFNSLPFMPITDNGAREVPLHSIRTLFKSQHMDVHLQLKNESDVDQPVEEFTDLGILTYRGTIRDGVNDSWTAIFTPPNSDEIVRLPTTKIRIKTEDPHSTSLVTFPEEIPQNREHPEKILGDFRGKDILSLEQFDRDSLGALFDAADYMKGAMDRGVRLRTLRGKSVALVFYEPSTRTRVSFSQATQRLEGGIELIENPEAFSSAAKGETLEDTIKILEGYHLNAVVLRHYTQGSARVAAQTAGVPIINAGDGAGEHPTQALLDLYTIRQKRGTLDNLTGVLGGDLKNGRTVHSLLDGLSLYKGNHIYLLAPDALKLSPDQVKEWTKKGLQLDIVTSFDEVPQDASFWYWTRIQKERMKGITEEEYGSLKEEFAVSQSILDKHGGNTMLMHPLPRVGEIKVEVDHDPRAYYFQQARNGLYVRQALVSGVLGAIKI